jgi:hypothetical protein
MLKTKILLIAIFCVSLTTNVFSQDNISPERKQAIDSLALEKIRDLSKYISIIGNKETPWSEANRVIERTLELFAENSQMGVSSLHREEIKYYGIREYFERLMALNYDKVTIKWYNIQYISDLELQPDGRYVGVITIYQRFEGESGDGLKYVDTTKKDITVYVERKQTQISGRLIGFWDVLLGDVRVTETMP